MLGLDNIEVKLHVMSRVDFCHLVTKNKMGFHLFKGFFRKRRLKSPYFGGNKN
jgi:hypothetical protein